MGEEKNKHVYIETVFFDFFTKATTLILPLLVIYILGDLNNLEYLGVYLKSGLVITFLSYFSGLGYDVLVVQRRSSKLAYDFIRSVFISGAVVNLLICFLYFFDFCQREETKVIFLLVSAMWFSHLLAQPWLVRILSGKIFFRLLIVRMIGILATVVVLIGYLKEQYYFVVFLSILNSTVVWVLLYKQINNGCVGRYINFSYVYKGTWRWRLRQIVNNLLDPLCTWMIVLFVHDPLKLASLTLGFRLISVSRKLGATGVRARLVGRMFKKQYLNYEMAGLFTLIIGMAGGIFLNKYLSINGLPLLTSSWLSSLLLLFGFFFLGFMNAKKEYSLWKNKEVGLSFLLTLVSCSTIGVIVILFDSLTLALFLVLCVFVAREFLYVLISRRK